MTEDVNDTRGASEPPNEEKPHSTGRVGGPREDRGSSESSQHGYDYEEPRFRRDR